MAVGNVPFPDMPVVPGVKLAAVDAGIKDNGRNDVVLFELVEGSRVAGVFTQNAFCAAPVTVCKQNLSDEAPAIRYLLVNSGNANACTGEQGMADALATCVEVARVAGVKPEQVLPFSTGVIGELLPMPKILPVIDSAYKLLASDGWADAGQGIMTTDTRAKGACSQFEYEGQSVVVAGISKGSGMIEPNMATMLGYIATNANIAQSILEQLSKQAANESFNRITVDGDTSTNDSCILIATGQTSLPEIESIDSPLYQQLSAAVIDIHRQLAKAIVTDGEGATKFVTIEVTGGGTEQECIDVAYSVARSPLVKTALFASDPNWGRIVAAIGYAGVAELDANKVTVHLGDVLIVENGGCAASYTEEQGQAVMDEENISIHIDLSRGDFSDRVWTTDLSHEYVTINAEYRS